MQKPKQPSWQKRRSIEFYFKQRVEIHEGIYLKGNTKELGFFDNTKALKLEILDDDNWSILVQFDENCVANPLDHNCIKYEFYIGLWGDSSVEIHNFGQQIFDKINALSGSYFIRHYENNQLKKEEQFPFNRMVYIDLKIRHHVEYEDAIYVVGPIEELKSEEYLEKAFRMKWHEGDIWAKLLAFTPDRIIKSCNNKLTFLFIHSKWYHRDRSTFWNTNRLIHTLKKENLPTKNKLLSEEIPFEIIIDIDVQQIEIHEKIQFIEGTQPITKTNIVQRYNIQEESKHNSNGGGQSGFGGGGGGGQFGGGGGGGGYYRGYSRGGYSGYGGNYSGYSGGGGGYGGSYNQFFWQNYWALRNIQRYYGNNLPNFASKYSGYLSSIDSINIMIQSLNTGDLQNTKKQLADCKEQLKNLRNLKAKDDLQKEKEQIDNFVKNLIQNEAEIKNKLDDVNNALAVYEEAKKNVQLDESQIIDNLFIELLSLSKQWGFFMQNKDKNSILNTEKQIIILLKKYNQFTRINNSTEIDQIHLIFICKMLQPLYKNVRHGKKPKDYQENMLNKVLVDFKEKLDKISRIKINDNPMFQFLYEKLIKNKELLEYEKIALQNQFTNFQFTDDKQRQEEFSLLKLLISYALAYSIAHQFNKDFPFFNSGGYNEFDSFCSETNYKILLTRDVLEKVKNFQLAKNVNQQLENAKKQLTQAEDKFIEECQKAGNKEKTEIIGAVQLTFDLKQLQEIECGESEELCISVFIDDIETIEGEVLEIENSNLEPEEKLVKVRDLKNHKSLNAFIEMKQNLND